MTHPHDFDPGFWNESPKHRVEPAPISSNNPFKYSPSQIKKFLIAGFGFLLTVISTLLANNIIPLEWLPWVNVVIGLGATYGVFAATNRPPGEIRPLE